VDRNGASPEPVDVVSLPPMHARGDELEVLADAVLRSTPRPPLIVGDVGSGRTLLAHHLARAIQRPVFALEATHYDDDEQLREALSEIHERGGVAIFDGMDRVAGDVPPPFLPALSHAWANGPTVITILTHEGRSRLEAWMPGVLETLDTILLDPLSLSDALAAVRLAAPAVLERHGVSLSSDGHLPGLVRAADQFLTQMAMPGRALDLLDLAAARCARNGATTVEPAMWVDIICQRTGLPKTRVEGQSEQDVLDLDAALARHVVGHTHVLETLAKLVRRNRAGFRGDRPIATALLLGPSGVGKTEIAKAMAQALFDRPDALVRIDMSEYAEAHAVARIVGAPPGYVGHEQGGALSDPLLQQAHRVVLLDEIEKAHRDVHQLLLQVFDEGRLTDGRGRTIDLRHSLLIMTSNLGSELMQEHADVDEQSVLAAARSAFPVELWNRIEAPLVLRPLTSDELRRVCRRLVARSSNRLATERGIAFELTETACDHLIALAGDDPALGARPLRHLLAREVEGLVADEILRGRLRGGQTAIVDHGERGFTLRARARR
jgi:ATP-dependent Clp protease ATP-binding subunit ClpC